MSETGQKAIIHEWVTLQNNHEQYERSALLIKLVAIGSFTAGLAWHSGTSILPGAFFVVLFFVQCVLWLQEAILRTSQARLGARLLRIEALRRNPDVAPEHTLQLHSEWQASRASTLGLLCEYGRNALRPTVAFPHAPLAALLALAAFRT